MRKGRNGEKMGGGKGKTDGNSGHCVIASSQPLERRPLERRTLVPLEMPDSNWLKTNSIEQTNFAIL